MSDARNKLIVWLLAAGVSGQAADAEADQILGNYAHELAEKIRESIGPLPLPHETVRTARFVQGHHAAADLIDSEVSDG